MATDPVERLIERAKTIVKILGKTWDTRLERILVFCANNPEAFPSRRGSIKIVTSDDVDNLYLNEYVGRFYREREGRIELKEVGTKPDPVVNEVLKAFAKVPEADIEKTAKAHRLSMQAENIVGKLLERYIAVFLENRGWVWCCGETMRSIDFIKDEDGLDPQLLQVKNRDNTENSSSSAIRTGTKIKKWTRSKSRSGKTCWETLPENDNASDTEKCTEQGFYKFVQEAAMEPIIEETPIEGEVQEMLQPKPRKDRLF